MLLKKYLCRLLLNILFCCFWLTYPSSEILAKHAVSINDAVKYDAAFSNFEYTDTSAIKGGTLVLHDIGSFDKLNPFTLKGMSPLGLENLIFETLAISSLDEPFVKYGLIAKDIEIAEDTLSMVITIDENARFSDNSEITSTDVLFSLDTMKSEKVHPLYGDYYNDIDKAEIIDKYKIRFIFKKKNRELPLIALDIPILSKKFYDKTAFGKESFSKPFLGSGPYVIDTVVQGKIISYKRNPSYWAKDKNVRRGMYNFDEIQVKYYKDQTVSVEAFKAGEFDVQQVNIAKQWARDLTGKKFTDGTIIKSLFPHSNNAGMQCFVFNLRRNLFKDIRVREAMSLAFDFEWTNESLFFGQYTRSDSFFSNSYLAARNLPEGLELQYLEPLKDKLPERVFTTPLQPPAYSKKGDLRTHLREAKKLLASAGWNVKDGVLANSNGDTFSFEILLSSPSFSRVMAPFVQNLQRLGIKADYRVVDQALYTERVQNFDFDMIVNVFGQSQSPGNEQRNYWHSQSAEKKGSGNVAGISSDEVDFLVEKIIYAGSQDELTAAVKALDRVLWYNYYVIPNWHLSGHRIVYYNKFRQPQTLPKYYNYFQLLMTWWMKNPQS